MQQSTHNNLFNQVDAENEPHWLTQTFGPIENETLDAAS